MARVTGPLFSMSASGSIGNALTYGKWKGREWVREWFSPQNPKTVKQVNVRTALSLLVTLWQSLSEEYQGYWDTYADPFSMSGFNKFVSKGMNAYILDQGVDVVPTSVTVLGDPPAEAFTWNAP